MHTIKLTWLLLHTDETELLEKRQNLWLVKQLYKTNAQIKNITNANKHTS